MVDFPYSITGLWRLTQLLCLFLRHSILQKRYSRSENTEEKWKPSNLTGSLITAEPPFSSCTSSVIDFWHYKTSFTTILSNFCQVQPGTIHNPADLTKKDINSGSTIQTQDALQPPRGLPPAPWAEAPTPQAGFELRNAAFCFSRLRNVPQTHPQRVFCAQLQVFLPWILVNWPLLKGDHTVKFHSAAFTFVTSTQFLWLLIV